MIFSIRTSRFRGLLILLFIFVAITGYQYYKVFAWQQISATVVATRQVCEYKKPSGRRSYYREYPFCNDDQEAARLIGDGYKLQGERRLWIEAVYESEPGRKASVTLSPGLEDAVGIKSGSAIEIRVSSGTAELAIMPNPVHALLVGGFAVAMGAYAFATRRGTETTLPDVTS
jgi:hypothetical protein